MIAALISWWLAIQVLGAIALPITSFLFDFFSLKGYALAKTIGLLTVGYSIWLLSMLGWARFDAGGILLAATIVLAVGLWALGSSGRQSLITMVRVRWKTILMYEIFFALLFLLGLWLRWNGATGAAIFGTEKPMDLAFLSGIIQSRTFPPQDPWLAGYAINYYYFGYEFVAVLAVLSAVGVGQAFNLGLVTTFALTGLTVAGLVVAMIEQKTKNERERCSRWGKRIAALLGVIFVLVLGNQAGAAQFLLGSPQAVALDGKQLASAAVQRLSGSTTIKIDPPLRASASDFGVVTELTPNPTAPFSWWWPSRAVWDEFEVSPGVIERRYAITEFPFFSFYLGDLHPHVLALPFDLLALTLVFATLVRPQLDPSIGDARRRLFLAITALILGGLYAINSWDAPTFVLLYAGALALRYRQQYANEKASSTLRRVSRTLVAVGSVAGVIIFPFLLTFQSFAGGGTVPEPKIPLVGLFSEMFGLAPDHTGLYEFVGFFGVFVLILLLYAANSRPKPSDTAQEHSVWSFIDSFAWVWPVGALIVGTLIGMPLLALLPLALVCWRAAWRCADQPILAFVLWTTAVGAMVILSADVVYLRDPFENRMNTVFKFYFQTWVIWGTVAAYGAWALWRQTRSRPGLRVLGGIPILLLCLGALVYPIATLSQGQPWATNRYTIDGLASFQASSPDEAAALAWIKKHTLPNDVVLTAVGSSYDGSTGWVAAVTGRPTLLGWSGSHERLWRRNSPDALAALDERERDVPTIYTTTDAATAEQLLKHHGVRYVFVGPTEQRVYAGAGLEKFQTFELVFQRGNVYIYRCP